MVGEAMVAGDRAVTGGTSGWWTAEANGNGSNGFRSTTEAEFIRRHHRHEPRENQCSSTLSKHIKAPIHLVRSHPDLDKIRSLLFSVIFWLVI